MAETEVKKRYVSADTDRYGNVRYYFRRRGSRKIRLSGLPWSPEFEASYMAALHAELAGPAFCVYFLRDGDNIKIGRTKDVVRRVSTLQAGCPRRLTLVLTVPGGAMVERHYHSRFAAYRISGEWFRLGHELQDFIRAERSRLRWQRPKELRPKKVGQPALITPAFPG